jgi:hypothetical protein
MKHTLLSMAVLLVVPMQSWGGSDEKENLAPIVVDPQATLTIRYPGDEPPLHGQHAGPPVRPDIPVVEGQRVPITRSPDGSCPKVRVDLRTYPEAPPAWFEDDGRHMWFPDSSSQTSERVDVERCEVVVDEAKSQIEWKRIRIRRPNARVRKLLEEMGIEIPIDPSHDVP